MLPCQPKFFLVIRERIGRAGVNASGSFDNSRVDHTGRSRLVRRRNSSFGGTAMAQASDVGSAGTERTKTRWHATQQMPFTGEFVSVSTRDPGHRS